MELYIRNNIGVSVILKNIYYNVHSSNIASGQNYQSKHHGAETVQVLAYWLPVGK